MDQASDILAILTDVAPLVLSTLILGSIVLFGLWGAVKVVIPAMRELVQMSEAQRKSWQAIVEEQKRVNNALMAEIQNDLTAERVERKKLAVRVEELSAELARKDQRIAELQGEINQLRKLLEDKDVLISDLRSELDRVKEDRKKVEKERDELMHRIEALEAAQKADIKPADGKPPEVKAA